MDSRSTDSRTLLFDDANMEPLTLTEMYEYLRSELKGLDLGQALEVESAKEFMQDVYKTFSQLDLQNHSQRTESMTRSFRSLVETIEVNVRAAKAKPKQAANPWMERIAQRAPMQEEDDEMNALRVVQNTIRVQVEGDLMLMLSPEFKIYP
ncbi:uncharacterized protein PITG_12720 [Phytophthora infestans T30-4]|uniref:Uncharacterized protein n=1 Tax=Phytophthora infestans (strain T30-4) TaxID=403677 RepID=D0NL05_PHYIT|nr:uncharacterized protein PITG_12720 [Phytophthora infestans T30-4]EEY60323.1 hypothetical protein PITG_12720 [Phytophthora infestans T30-4]|eukprot:XP_002900119.1 hypothetical protein PITG_12720 [Phytophthora infestans T30-4]